MDGISEILRDEGIPHAINGYPAMFSYALGVEKVTDQRSWNMSDKDHYIAIVDALIHQGVMPDHDPREPWFLCYAHGEKEIDDTLTIFRDTIKLTKHRISFHKV